MDRDRVSAHGRSRVVKMRRKVFAIFKISHVEVLDPRVVSWAKAVYNILIF
jgi:hypothetical protein